MLLEHLLARFGVWLEARAMVKAATFAVVRVVSTACGWLVKCGRPQQASRDPLALTQTQKQWRNVGKLTTQALCSPSTQHSLAHQGQGRHTQHSSPP
jgi:hypothetical protein